MLTHSQTARRVETVMIKVCIIEDEPEIRKLLRLIIEKQEGFQVVSESENFAQAVSEFTRYRPDVAFVDIDLNGDSGLECAKVLTELNPKLKVIFATAHAEYMANAFEIYAFDYLVKPFNVERVVKTLNRIKGEAFSTTSTGISSAMETGDNSLLNEGGKLTSEEETVALPEQYSNKLMIRGKEQVLFVDTKDIVLIERAENATRIVTREEEYKVQVSLGGIEEKLNPNDFMRCHKSYIINLSMISKLEPYGRWTYVVKFKGTKETALMTSQKYDELKKLFG